MGNCIEKPFIVLVYGNQKRPVSKKQFQTCKNMEQLVRLGGFFPIARIISMKTSDRGVFPWDSPTLYPELEVYIEDMYGMKKQHIIYIMPLYRKS